MKQRINPIYLVNRAAHKTLQRVGPTTYMRTRGGFQNLWRDDLKSIGVGWTNNGDGSYTCNGTDSFIDQDVASGELTDGYTYDVEFTVTNYTTGIVQGILLGPDDVGVTNDVTFPGVTQERVTISTTTSAAPLRIAINGTGGFIGTVSKISVKQVLQG